MNINRRNFLKKLGAGAVGASTLLAACKNKSDNITDEATGQHEPAKGKMTMRTNANTGDEVSILGFGMMRLPMNEDPESDIPYDQEMINKQVDYAIEHGVNYFDTSPAYNRGVSERCTGIALSRHKREQYYIATKLSNFDPSTWSTEASQEMFANSLKELQVDYIDYLLLHCIGMGANDLEGNELDGMEAFEKRFMENGILDWLVQQKEAGKIRNLGFSYHGDVEVFDTLLQWHDEGKYHWDFVQIEANYLDWEYADEINSVNTDASYLYNELQSRSIPVVVMEPLLGGRLAKLPNSIVAKMKARRPEESVASWAFRFAGSLDGVLTVLSGMTYMEHLKDNLCTYAPLDPINEDEAKFLFQIAEEVYNLKNIPCNECNYCMPCPYGIDIPAIFAHYNKMIKEGYVSHDNQDPEYARHRKAFLVGYDRSVPRLRQADHCIGCGHCMSHCPQQIEIPSELQEIDRYVEQLKQSTENNV